MADIVLKDFVFPDIPENTYKLPTVDVDDTLATTGAAADAKKVGDEISDLKADFQQTAQQVGEVVLAENADFTSDTIYLSTGTTTTISHRKNTDFIACDKLAYIDFKLRGLNATNNNIAIVSFFDANKTFLRCYASPVATAITGRLPVPTDAYYLRGAIVDNDSTEYYIKGVYKGSLTIKNTENEYSVEAMQGVAGVSMVTPNYFIPNSNGDMTTLSQRFTCYPVDISRFSSLKIASVQLTNPVINAISFFNDKLEYISGVASTKYGLTEIEVAIPTNAKYATIPFLSTVTGCYMRGITKSSIGSRLNIMESIIVPLPTYTKEVVNQYMSIDEFRTAFNAEIANYAALTKCSENSFHPIYTTVRTWQQVYECVNKVFRKTVYYEGMDHGAVCDRINHAFEQNIWMWKDAKYNDGTARDFSLAFAERSGEPSAIVSPDGGTLYVYGYNGRWSTTDGLNWSEKTTLTYSGEPNNGVPEHANVNLIDGMYYMIGRSSRGDNDLVLFTSENGIDFQYNGIVLKKDSITIDSESVYIWGNSYVLKDANTYYLYVEAKLTNNANFWDIYLCTGTSPVADNGDGTVGDWVYSGTGAIIGDDIISSSVRAHGNPDFAKGPDNRPIRVNGKWYMYYHMTYHGEMYIYRACSDDLRNWTVEGRIINNRDIPTAGEASAGNADHSLIEFKGKTYLFYTWDINSANTPYLRYVIDDRPFRELLKMYP